MKYKTESDLLYVIYILEPLEEVIKRVQVANRVSQDELEKLDRLLLKKYLMLEEKLQDKLINYHDK